MAIQDGSVELFLEELASKASTPGGGSAAAIMGALGAALTSMVCNLTLGKKRYAAVEAEMSDVLAQAEGLRADLVAAIEDDVDAFDAVMGAYALPKDTVEQEQERHRDIQEALLLAIDAPLACARLCHSVMGLAEIAAAKGNAAVISDGGVAILCAYAGLRACALNVYVNAKSLDDRAAAASRLASLEALLGDAGARAEATYRAVAEKLR